MFQATLKKSKMTQLLRILLGLVLGVLTAILSVRDVTSYVYLLTIPTLLLLGMGIYGSIRLAISQGTMKKFQVGTAQEKQFEEEYAQWHLDAAGGSQVRSRNGKVQAQLTQSFLFIRKPSCTILLPLNEVIWFYKHVLQPAGTNSVWIYFSSGKIYDVFCGEQSVLSNVDNTGTWLTALVRLCPQALAGYSHRRAAAYAKDRKSFISDIQKGIRNYEDE